VIGLIGGLIVGRDRSADTARESGAATDMAKRLETIDRSCRRIFAQSRAKQARAAKNQRENYQIVEASDRLWMFDCRQFAGRQRKADR